MGGLPDQSESPEGRAIFTESYAFLPANLTAVPKPGFLWPKVKCC